jgi:hypothetical protein
VRRRTRSSPSRQTALHPQACRFCMCQARGRCRRAQLPIQTARSAPQLLRRRRCGRTCCRSSGSMKTRLCESTTAVAARTRSPGIDRVRNRRRPRVYLTGRCSTLQFRAAPHVEAQDRKGDSRAGGRSRPTGVRRDCRGFRASAAGGDRSPRKAMGLAQAQVGGGARDSRSSGGVDGVPAWQQRGNERMRRRDTGCRRSE